MRLKSLELQGYKTFAAKTLFEFAGAVTCIVGPNGSGKSNIGDSLRWVLGEQSYHLLRGKKTEDMIFSGSEQRARSSMAAATVTFDNSDGWLPIDFSDVAVTRRAYRDGTNEYLVNGQRVRLKDISELLAASGLAERTYTIIGQGVVDAALSLKAEERRRLFEEAAGIGLHRSRREEAIRRLEATRRNLERVEDILAELSPRLRSLERQSRRAAEYEQVRADLQILLREWYGYHWHIAQQEHSEARRDAKTAATQLHGARQQVEIVESQYSEFRTQLTGLRQKLNDWYHQLAELNRRREELSREDAVAYERQRLLHEQQGRLASEINQYEESVGLEAERLKAATRNIQYVEQEQTETLEQAKLAQEALTIRQEERGRAEGELIEVRQSLSTVSARQGNLQARQSERLLQIARQEKTVASAGLALEGIEEDFQQSQARLLKSEEAFHAEERALKRVQDELVQVRSKLARAETERKEAQEQHTTINSELAGARAQAEVLEQAERSLASYTAGAQVILRIKVDETEGRRVALSNLIETPTELETAIAAALGEYMDSVILDNEKHAEVAIDALEAAEARGTIISKTSLASGSKLPLDLNELPEGVIGLASRLIKAPQEVQPIIDLLLGQTLIIQDRAAARRLLPQLIKEPSFRLVTLSGVIFDASGPIHAGKERKQSALSRQRTRREHAALVVRLQKELERAELRLSEFTQAWEALQKRYISLETDERAKRDAENKARSIYNQQMMAQDQAAKQIEWQKSQIAQITSEIQRMRTDLNVVADELQLLETETARIRDLLKEKTQSLSSMPVDELQAKLVHWNTEAALAARTVEESRRRAREIEQALAAVQQRYKIALSRQFELEIGLAEIDTGHLARKQESQQVSVQIDELQLVITPAEQELEEYDQKQAAHQEAEGAARASLSRAEHNHAQARILLARRQEALETWRHRIEDDFGLVNFEYAESVTGPTLLPLDGLVETLPRVISITPDLEEKLRQQRAQLRRMGPINPEAQQEYREVKDRFEFMTAQVADLHRAEEDVRQVIAELDDLMQKELRTTFDAVADEFSGIFRRLFGGGSAKLLLTDPEDMTNTGIEIEARLPGRRTQGLTLLSGGERSLTAAALVFALLKISPTPFCLLDEVDAMLDEANVARFRELLRELSQQTQFIVVTHNRNTVQAADVIYGVTMGRDSSSQVISLKLDEVEQAVIEN